MGTTEDEGGPPRPYILGMQLLQAIRARVQRRPSPRPHHPKRFDALIALLFLVEAELEVVLLMGGARYAWLAALLELALAGALAIRRTAPLASLVLGLTAFVAFQPLGREVNDDIISAFFAVLFLLFSFGLHEQDDRRMAAGAVLGFAANGLALTIDAYPSTVVDFFTGGLVIAVGPILLGRVIRSRSDLNATLRAKTEQLRRARTDQAEQAAVEERNRIAGELHDVVAHAMSAMVVQAGGARRLATKDPDRAREAFVAVEETGREALTEIRRLLGVLRREDEEIALAPQPSLRHLDSLVRRAQSAGLPVVLDVDGDVRELPPGVDLTAFRLVQAALAGALEQGGAGRAAVSVRYAPDGIELEVVDDGAAAADRSLAGVRERVSLYGGHLQSGRRRGGGHTVRAQLPVGGAS
jgi:signal transduction histidine kinase